MLDIIILKKNDYEIEILHHNTNLNYIRFLDRLSNLHLHHNEHHHQDALEDKKHEQERNLNK